MATGPPGFLRPAAPPNAAEADGNQCSRVAKAELGTAAIAGIAAKEPRNTSAATPTGASKKPRVLQSACVEAGLLAVEKQSLERTEQALLLDTNAGSRRPQ